MLGKEEQRLSTATQANARACAACDSTAGGALQGADIFRSASWNMPLVALQVRSEPLLSMLWLWRVPLTRPQCSGAHAHPSEGVHKRWAMSGFFWCAATSHPTAVPTPQFMLGGLRTKVASNLKIQYSRHYLEAATGTRARPLAHLQATGVCCVRKLHCTFPDGALRCSLQPRLGGLQMRAGRASSC